jgi:dTDP-4-dehydrorhamnose reductase
MRVLVLGARGMLGTDLLNEWQSDELVPAGSAEADLRDFAQVSALVQKVRPNWIILSAAYTDVDGCERDPELAFAVNARGVENVARAAQASGARVFLVSTDYVFNGKGVRPYETTDATAPLNVYGASKAAGEEALRKHHSAWSIGRTSWLFGVHGPSFPEKILRAAEARPELSVVNDQIGSPTYTRDLAAAIRDLVLKDARGIVHVTNEGICSWFDFAREILARSGRDSIPVRPITTDQSARPARRPNYSVLSPASLHAYGVRLRPWQDALEAFLQERSRALNS